MLCQLYQWELVASEKGLSHEDFQMKENATKMLRESDKEQPENGEKSSGKRARKQMVSFFLQFDELYTAEIPIL